jgi:hypothetical protein
MKRRYLPSEPLALAAILAIAIMAGCNQTQPPQQTAAVAPPKPSEKLFVTFEGPWAFAPDPNDSNSVLAMTVLANYHHKLFVKAAYNKELEAGVYDLSLPPRTAPPTGTVDPDILRAKIDPNVVKRVLADKLHRYVIRLPKPETYLPAERYRSSAGPNPHPLANGVQAREWATGVSLLYSVGSLNTSQLAGTPDSGTFPTYSLQLDIPHISFILHPVKYDQSDKCYPHEKRAFRDLTGLLGITLYLDYTDSPSNCPDAGTQKHLAKAQMVLPSLLQRMGAFAESTSDVREAGVVPGSWLGSLAHGPIRSVTARVLAAAFYFFGAPTGDCKTPIIVSTDTGG